MFFTTTENIVVKSMHKKTSRHCVKIQGAIAYSKNVGTGSNGVCNAWEYTVVEHAALRVSLKFLDVDRFRAKAGGPPFIADSKRVKITTGTSSRAGVKREKLASESANWII